VIEALKKLMVNSEAEKAINLLTGRDGFNEFYDPVSGRPRGSKGQLWMAGLSCRRLITAGLDEKAKRKAYMI